MAGKQCPNGRVTSGTKQNNQQQARVKKAYIVEGCCNWQYDDCHDQHESQVMIAPKYIAERSTGASRMPSRQPWSFSTAIRTVQTKSSGKTQT